MSAPLHRARFAVACLALAVGGAAIAGCGDEAVPSGPPGPDPAALVPADAPLYVDAVIRPEGDQAADVDGALSKLLATDDPGGFIVDQLDGALDDEDAGITYESDIAPWLGPRAAFFFETFTEEPEGAALVATTDPAATQEALDKVAKADVSREHPATYKGIDYEIDNEDGDATGIVGEFLVAGTEQGFKDVVDASQGSPLADDSDFKSQSDAAPAGWLGFAYADPQEIVSQLEDQGALSEEHLKAAGPRVSELLSQPVTASLGATSDEVSLETSAAAGEAPAPESSALLEDLPGDSWFAFGSPNAGAGFAQGVENIPDDARDQVKESLGFDASSLGDWVGGVSGFVKGTSLFGLGAALVVETTDEQASAETLQQVQDLVSRESGVSVQPVTGEGEEGFSVSVEGAPIEIQVVQKEGKVVAGLGSASVSEALSPSSSLADSEVFGTAHDALGDDLVPAFYLDFVPLFQLVNGFGEASGDPDYQQAKPYLDHLSYLIAGSAHEGDRETGKLVLGLRESTAQAPAGSDATPTSSAAVSP